MLHHQKMLFICIIEIHVIWKWWKLPIDQADIIWKRLEDVFGTSTVFHFPLLMPDRHCRKPFHFFFYYHFRLVIDKNTKCLIARVQHYTGKVVLESSTDEWCIAQHLYKPYDTSAYINFGRVGFCLSAFHKNHSNKMNIFISHFHFFPVRFLLSDALKLVLLKWKIIMKPFRVENWRNFSKN